MGAAAADCARERTAETALAAPCRNASVDTADAVVSALFVVVAVVDPLVDCRHTHIKTNNSNKKDTRTESSASASASSAMRRASNNAVRAYKST